MKRSLLTKAKALPMTRNLLLALVAGMMSLPVWGQYPSAVDLGLPSGVKWANANLGAAAPSEYGNYYAWGETEPKNRYDWTSYKWGDGTPDVLSKYNTDPYHGPVDGRKVIAPEDDVAHVRLGGKWRIPTREEFLELRAECIWTWTAVNGIPGFEIKSRVNGNSIFLPAAGFWQGDHPVGVGLGLYGDYWTSSLGWASPEFAFNVTFNSTMLDLGSFERTYGFSIRPVCD